MHVCNWYAKTVTSLSKLYIISGLGPELDGMIRCFLGKYSGPRAVFTGFPRNYAGKPAAIFFSLHIWQSIEKKNVHPGSSLDSTSNGGARS